MTSYTIRKNTHFNSLEISFSEKPAAEIRDILKGFRFRWNHTLKIWYGFRAEKELRSQLDKALLKDIETVKKTFTKKLTDQEAATVEKIEKPAVKVEEKKTEKAVNPFLKPKTKKVKNEAGKLKAAQENALITLVKYNYIGKRRKQRLAERRIYAVKGNTAFIGNPYAVVKINTDLLTDETKKQLEELSKESHVSYEGIEKIYNNAVKIQKNASSLTLENMKEEETDGIKIACFDSGLAFNYMLLKDVCRCFNYNVTIKAAENMKPALIEGEGFSAIACGIKKY